MQVVDYKSLDVLAFGGHYCCNMFILFRLLQYLAIFLEGGEGGGYPVGYGSGTLTAGKLPLQLQLRLCYCGGLFSEMGLPGLRRRGKFQYRSATNVPPG